MGMTLLQFKEVLGDRIDAAMARISSFEVPRAEYCDLDSVHVFQDLPRAVYYWSLKPERDAVVDIVTEKDYEAMTATATQRIPHKILIQVSVMADDVDDVTGQFGADSMRDAMMSEFGDRPCLTDGVEGNGVPLLYKGFADGPGESDGGIYTYTFTYEGLIFLNGRSEAKPLIAAINLDLEIGHSIEPAAEADSTPTPDDDAVTVIESVGITLQL